MNIKELMWIAARKSPGDEYRKTNGVTLIIFEDLPVIGKRREDRKLYFLFGRSRKYCL